MCGILGVMATSPVNQLLYDGLMVLQHRGQDAAGIATAVTFLVSLFVASRLYARIGVVNAVLLLPSAYLAGFVLFALNFSLINAALARLLQLIVLGGIAGTAYSTFFNVVPSDKRGQVRSFDSGVPEQIGVCDVVVIGLKTTANAEFARLLPPLVASDAFYKANVRLLGLAYSLAVAPPAASTGNSRADTAAPFPSPTPPPSTRPPPTPPRAPPRRSLRPPRGLLHGRADSAGLRHSDRQPAPPASGGVWESRGFHLRRASQSRYCLIRYRRPDSGKSSRC